MSKSDSHVAIPRAREPKAQILAPVKCLRIRALNSFKIFLSAWDIKVSPLFLFFSKPQVVFHVIHGRKWNYLFSHPCQGLLKVPFEVIPKGGRNSKSSLDLNLRIRYNGGLSLFIITVYPQITLFTNPPVRRFSSRKLPVENALDHFIKMRSLPAQWRSKEAPYSNHNVPFTRINSSIANLRRNYLKFTVLSIFFQSDLIRSRCRWSERKR